MNKKLNIAFVLAFCILATALYLVVFASGGIATSQADDSVEGIKPGKRAQAADFTLLDVDGRRVSLSDYRGKVVFLNFWATWCNPCRAEFPSLAQMAKRFEGKDFELLTISIDEGGRPAVEAFFRQMGMSLPTALDSKSEVARKYGLVGVPESFLIDKKGRVAKKYVGPYNWTAPSVLSLIEHLLSTPAS